MIRYFQVIFVLSIIVYVPSSAIAQTELIVFGGPEHDQYLGCLVCNEFSSNSICNEFGSYGNVFSSKGMFNEFAGFGNKFSSSSPWNEFSTSKSVPVVVDRDGNFYGYFTINDTRSDAFQFATDLKEIFKSVNGDLAKVREILCKSLGYGN